ncbi:hypothetical protein KHS38_21090 [Mucilaginibacter sp. Bleaf8]|uniref:hypothetical protein n=1 Tax=Mucilaginibacter sp. Bleaf8 TaxID=2834430 RepID=UPI001BCCDA34|nr:hypothetical protein [Mucilaginibacter sp. Bleaf8]MBS7566914.1 hypothetical protein [Mucilaginibacter sp. Bleaf8]
MKFIGYNSDIINFLKDDLTLLNAIVKSYKVHEVEGIPAVSILFELAYTDADLMLTFREIFSNSFDANPATEQYQVDSCKFYHIGSKVYLSLDPDESEEGVDTISEYDNDVILCSSVEGYLFEAGAE